MEVKINNLNKYFMSTGAMDHPQFWIDGAENIIPNLIECIKLTGYESTIKNIDDYENKKQDELKELFVKYGSDKFIHSYYKFYSNVLADKKDIDVLEIGIGTKNPKLPSTMYFYEQDKNFCSTPGSSLRALRDYIPNSNVYGADVDKDIIFEEDRIKCQYVNQLDKSTLSKLFENQSFDFMIVDGLHHITADLNSVLELVNRIKPGGKLVVEDISILENWLVVDFILSKVEGLNTYIIKDNCYMYVIEKN